MEKISKVTLTSDRNIGLQVLKDSLTPTEKKIIIQMINGGLNEGRVRNKIFQISKTGINTAEIVIGTITKSSISGKNETVRYRVKIKYA